MGRFIWKITGLTVPGDGFSSPMNLLSPDMHSFSVNLIFPIFQFTIPSSSNWCILIKPLLQRCFLCTVNLHETSLSQSVLAPSFTSMAHFLRISVKSYKMTQWVGGSLKSQWSEMLKLRTAATDCFLVSCAALSHYISMCVKLFCNFK